MEMISTNRRYLDRRTTGISLASLVTTEAQDDEEKPRQVDENSEECETPSQSSSLEENKGLHGQPVKDLGPDSEGIEVITGPTVERRQQTSEPSLTPVENEYAKELLSQFSRPQTLMLKDTMPYGTLLMPPMPPLSGIPDSEAVPEVVNFDKDDAEFTEASAHGAPEIAHKDDADRHQSRPLTGQSNKVSVQRETLQDIVLIPSSLERTKAYNDLRQNIIMSPNPLLEWTTYQMQHNNGDALLNSEVIKINPQLSIRKTRSKLGSIGGSGKVERHGSQEEIPTHRTEEKLERMGRGAMNLGEKAGGKIGGWIKRAGKKV